MNNPETCQCVSCSDWREIVKSICKRLNLFIHNTKEQAVHNWNIMKSRYKYAEEV